VDNTDKIEELRQLIVSDYMSKDNRSLYLDDLIKLIREENSDTKQK